MRCVRCVVHYHDCECSVAAVVAVVGSSSRCWPGVGCSPHTSHTDTATCSQYVRDVGCTITSIQPRHHYADSAAACYYLTPHTDPLPLSARGRDTAPQQHCTTASAADDNICHATSKQCKAAYTGSGSTSRRNEIIISACLLAATRHSSNATLHQATLIVIRDASEVSTVLIPPRTVPTRHTTPHTTPHLQQHNTTPQHFHKQHRCSDASDPTPHTRNNRTRPPLSLPSLAHCTPHTAHRTLVHRRCHSIVRA